MTAVYVLAGAVLILAAVIAASAWHWAYGSDRLHEYSEDDVQAQQAPITSGLLEVWPLNGHRDTPEEEQLRDE